LKKGDIGGFALARFGKIPPTPLYKGGNIIYGQALNPKGEPLAEILKRHSRGSGNPVFIPTFWTSVPAFARTGFTGAIWFRNSAGASR
jgi:hypothetical protein